jgi:hypothetical protein
MVEENINELSLLATIRAKAKPLSDHAVRTDISEDLARSTRTRRIGEPCPTCKQLSLVCCYAEVSSDPHHYYDYWCHVCLNPACAYGAHWESRTQVGQETKDDGVCPFCGRDVFGGQTAHSEAPLFFDDRLHPTTT